MDDKKAEIGNVSPKDVFKASRSFNKNPQSNAVKQKNQLSYMSESYKLPSMLAKAGKKDKILLQAIFLHDLVDWTNTSLDEIKEEFGAIVASVLEEVTAVDSYHFSVEESLAVTLEEERHQRGAVNSLSKSGKLRLSDLIWQMTILVERKKEGKDKDKKESFKSLAILKQAMDILIFTPKYCDRRLCLPKYF